MSVQDFGALMAASRARAQANGVAAGGPTQVYKTTAIAPGDEGALLTHIVAAHPEMEWFGKDVEKAALSPDGETPSCVAALASPKRNGQTRRFVRIYASGSVSWVNMDPVAVPDATDE